MIQPEYKSLASILSDKLFNIPEYQRHYSWQGKQRKDLFEDIKKLQEAKEKYSDREHFMATVVCLKTKNQENVGSNSFYIYDVVDGQQRLTTLVILLKAISIRLEEIGEEKEANELNKILVKDDGRLIILQNNHDNKNILRQYLEKGTKPEKTKIKTVADENIFQAIKDCEKFVGIYISVDSVVKLLSLIKNSLFFIFQSLEDKGAVYTIFEVLNSRGLAVDWLDKCKSLLMGLLYEFTTSPDNDVFSQHLNEIHGYWSDIYRAIGLQEIPGDEIIRFAATLKSDSDSGRLLSSEDSLEFFKNDCLNVQNNHQKSQRIIDNTIWIREITFCLKNLYSDYRRNAVTEITQARLLAIAIMLRKDLKEEDRNKLLDQWERVTFRIFGMYRRDSRTKVGVFTRTAKNIQKDANSDLAELLQSIAEIGDEFDIKNALTELEKNDCYNGWQKELRYFFYRYEEYLSQQNNKQLDKSEWVKIWKANPNNTIEHILPQNKGLDCWDEIADEEHLRYLNRLGNLTLLSPGFNSEAGNKCFKDKRLIYERVNLIALEDVFSKKKWTVKSIEERTKKLLAFAKYQWEDLKF